MPTYEYVCGVCGHREDQVRRIEERDDPADCPVCPRPLPGKTLERDVVGSMKAHTDMGYQSPILSESLGVHPDQIPAMKRMYPHHNYTPDGRMVLSSHSERNKVLKELGFYDKN